MTATVIPFPTNRRVGKIRKTASELCKKAGERKRGEGYWRVTVDTMARHMAKAGFDDATIDRELAAFSNAVGVEMARCEYLAQHGGTA